MGDAYVIYELPRSHRYFIFGLQRRGRRDHGLTTISPLIDMFYTDDLLQEVRLASSQERPFKWLVGGFFENYRFNDCETITQAGVSGLAAASGGNPGNYLESTCLHIGIRDEAGFAEASYDLIDDLTLTAGAVIVTTRSRRSITEG